MSVKVIGLRRRSGRCRRGRTGRHRSVSCCSRFSPKPAICRDSRATWRCSAGMPGCKRRHRSTWEYSPSRARVSQARNFSLPGCDHRRVAFLQLGHQLKLADASGCPASVLFGVTDPSKTTGADASTSPDTIPPRRRRCSPRRRPRSRTRRCLDHRPVQEIPARVVRVFVRIEDVRPRRIFPNRQHDPVRRGDAAGKLVDGRTSIVCVSPPRSMVWRRKPRCIL